jgi:hypothetical protein
MNASVRGETTTFHPPWLARTLNISTGGIALHVAEPFEVDSVLTIRLRTPSAKSPPLQVRVIYSSQQTNGTWVLGAGFTKEITENELQELIG